MYSVRVLYLLEKQLSLMAPYTMNSLYTTHTAVYYKNLNSQKVTLLLNYIVKLKSNKQSFFSVYLQTRNTTTEI